MSFYTKKSNIRDKVVKGENPFKSHSQFKSRYTSKKTVATKKSNPFKEHELKEKTKELDIEIIDFFTIKNDPERSFLSGTLHIYLTNLQLDIRGIYLRKDHKKWIIAMPYFTANNIDPDADPTVKYPIINFVDHEKNRILRRILKKKAKEYVRKNVLNQHV